eukprot:gb/GECH01005703.1/.p1 GENE.gb/GECH01005703.1/~~gb/GECH01005703.1/.p1  ORF type:complete len:220 (+),score=48.65 gb/GECH01005703.1/:1-660(+)
MEMAPSKGARRARLCIGLSIMCCCILLVVGVVLCLVFLLPRSPQFGITDIGFGSFSLSYCPSDASQETECCGAQGCRFSLDSLNVVSNISITVSNPNFVDLTVSNFTGSVVLNRGSNTPSLQLGSSVSSPISIPARSDNHVAHLPVSWSAANVDAIRTVLCILQVQNSVSLSVTASSDEAKVITSSSPVELQDTRSVDMTQSCAQTQQNCELYQSNDYC